MGDASRHYPALDLSWPVRPDDGTVDQLLAELDEAHPTAVEDQPNRVRLFFATASDRDRAVELVATHAPDILVSAIEVSDEAWAERSQAALGPVRVGRLVVAPPWSTGGVVATGPSSDDHLITIQPSMGFGTGHHESTRLCLGLLQEQELTGLSMLDVGTGSGVLALAAWRLGARRVVAIDVDRDALASARENLELNSAADAVRLLELDLTRGAADLIEEFDLVTANLTGGMLERFVPVLSRWVRPGGSLIASGFQPDEEGAVSQALGQSGLDILARVVEGDWVAVRAIGIRSSGT